MSKRIVVVGAGAWGGWSAFKLQEAGYDVTLVEKKGAGHSFSGSGGRTRIIRMAYGGHQKYTDMVAHSFNEWEKYARKWGETLYHPKSALWLFRDIPSTYAEASIPLMKEKGYELRVESLEEIKGTYPEISLDDITSVYSEQKVWFLEAAKSCGVVAREFEKIGGTFIRDEALDIECDVTKVQVKCSESIIEADLVVVASGPWANKLVPELEKIIHVTRQEVYYFDAPENYNELPIWVEFREGDQMYYGIPDHFGEGFKFAYDERQWALDPDKDDRGVTPEILDKMSSILTNRFPELVNPEVIKYHTCVYENSIDGDFIIDQKHNGRLLYLAGSSGHGFKMGPAIGQMMVDTMNGKPLPEEFAIARFNDNLNRKSQYQMN